MEKKKIKIKIQFQKNYIPKELCIENTLIQIREELSKEIDFPFIFLNEDEEEILKEKESSIKLKDILDGKYLYIKKEIKRDMLGTKIGTNHGLNFYLYPKKELSPIEKNISLNIMLIGETGTGKSCFINSLFNYLQGIQLEENNRYYLFDERTFQGRLKENHYKIYDIESTKVFNNPIRVIDTQGFGDSPFGVEEKLIEKDILSLFTKEIDYLNAICLFIKSSDKRVKKVIIGILAKLFSLFVKKIINNIIIIFTFAYDFKNIPALEYLFGVGCPLYQILGNIKDLNYFIFNNSAYFSDDRDSFSPFFYNNIVNYEKLLKCIYKLNPLTLDISTYVISESFKISNTIVNIINELSDNIIKMNTIIKNRNSIKKIKDELEIISDSPYKIIKANKQIKEYYNENYRENCSKGWYVFFCNSCNKICHYNCLGPNENLKENKCKIIEFDQCLSYCKCHYQKHEYRDYLIKIKNSEKIWNIETWENDNKIIIDENEKKEKREILKKEEEKRENEIKLLDNQIQLLLEDIIDKISLINQNEKNLKDSGIKINNQLKYSYCKKILNEINKDDKTKNIINKIFDDIESIHHNVDEKQKYITNIINLLDE